MHRQRRRNWRSRKTSPCSMAPPAPCPGSASACLALGAGGQAGPGLRRACMRPWPTTPPARGLAATGGAGHRRGMLGALRLDDQPSAATTSIPRRHARTPWPATADPEASPRQCWLRAERQTFFPVGQGTRQAVFTIRVMLQPLAEAVQAPGAGAAPARFAGFHVAAVLDYKNLSRGARAPAALAGCSRCSRPYSYGAPAVAALISDQCDHQQPPATTAMTS